MAPSSTPSFLPSNMPSSSPSVSTVPSTDPSSGPSGSIPSSVPSLLPSVSQAPSIQYATAVCGSSLYIGSRFCQGTHAIKSKNVKLGVRCCSDSEKDGWTKNSDCSVWATSKTSLDGCHVKETWHDATKLCVDAGGRLCTKDEMMADCTRLTGCQLDQRLIWTSTK